MAKIIYLENRKVKLLLVYAYPETSTDFLNILLENLMHMEDSDICYIQITY